MGLPEKTFLTKDCRLFESDFDCNRQVKQQRVMQFLQDAATEHAKILGLGWDEMDANGMLWVLSKVKIVYDTPVCRGLKSFTLYTWPLQPHRVFAERCFTAVDGEKQLFSATSMWTIISRDSRKILPAETMNDYYRGEYSAAHSDVAADFLRVRMDDTFEFCYEKTIRRSDLDINAHANNTNYIDYALDVLSPQEKISELEIVYHKELKLNDRVEIFYKRESKVVQVVGVREEPCFSVVLKLAD